MPTKPHEHEYDPRYDKLLYCLKCGGAEASLPSSCPGRQMTPDEDDLVAAGELDFQRTRNTLEYSWWKKALPLGPLNHKVILTDAEMDAAGWTRKVLFVPAADAVNLEMLEALKGVVRVADRDTQEFAAARAAIMRAAPQPQQIAEPVVVVAMDNPWRESIESILKGDNYFRAGEWYELLSDLDRLYALEAAFNEHLDATHEARGKAIDAAIARGQQK